MSFFRAKNKIVVITLCSNTLFFAIVSSDDDNEVLRRFFQMTFHLLLVNHAFLFSRLNETFKSCKKYCLILGLGAFLRPIIKEIKRTSYFFFLYVFCACNEKNAIIFWETFKLIFSVAGLKFFSREF